LPFQTPEVQDLWVAGSVDLDGLEADEGVGAKASSGARISLAA